MGSVAVGQKLEAQVFSPAHALGLPILLALTKVAAPSSALGCRIEGAMDPEGTEECFRSPRQRWFDLVYWFETVLGQGGERHISRGRPRKEYCPAYSVFLSGSSESAAIYCTVAPWE